jgi:putative hydrolase of the HAD superfamily
VIVVSEEVGIAKPNPEIFRITWEQMGCPELSGILMVGDSLASDIQGGVNFGIATCWYNPNQLPLPAEPRIDHNLTDLTKFPELVLDRSV